MSRTLGIVSHNQTARPMAYRPASMGENRLGNTPETHSGRLHKRTGELNG
ncbi:hypothetical protein MOE47_16035 [Bacillus atrophaeus]|nr:hypothetical protein [Bacillus atrophaeus]MCY8911598.1 hypothetical protein [Bacillus atrophaeus]MCY9115882.1 hypothetical protein [Bacillus atrophaeus]MCY9196146.1 hypothetical protein [Bacillus atrophaeus]MEC0926134.1 hypothetical protein [Bacillus atrophaeus]MEC0935326.1 hypothetical protein [Bacillus atrophaeus]